MRSLQEENILALLLEIKEIVKSHLNDTEFLFIELKEEKFKILRNEIPDLSGESYVIALYLDQISEIHSKSVVLRLDENYTPHLVRNEWMEQKSLDFLLLYLPICFFPLKAFRLKRSVTLLHFAQSLDGRIATNSGSSKWIGNHENLVHAHWLRALCDGILIGSNTLKIDKPRLNVRLVKGPNPVKFVIGTSAYEFDSLLENPGQAYLITTPKNMDKPEIETIIIPRVGDFINPLTVLSELYERGIQSLFIEGGAYTGSVFLEGKAIDFLQLFISPRIFGSGIAGFSLREIKRISDSIEFSSPAFWPMGNGILFSGEVKY